MIVVILLNKPMTLYHTEMIEMYDCYYAQLPKFITITM
jgi:hypothetical protein